MFCGSRMTEQQAPQTIEWNDALERLLCEESEKFSGLAWLHTRSEAFYARKTNWLQIPSIVLSTITGFLSGAQIPELPQIALGAISISVAVLGTINSYFAYQKRAEGHRLGGVQYAALAKTIAIEMALPRSQRIPPKYMLKTVKEEGKRLAETLPRIPDNILAAYKATVGKQEGVSHPEITNGIHHIEPYKVVEQPTETHITQEQTPKGVRIHLAV